MIGGSELRGVSSSTRTLDERDLASLRPAAPAKLKQAAARPILREVTSGIVCFCGERFGEHQALEFMLHLRAEVGENLDQLKKYRSALRAASQTYRDKHPDRVKETRQSFREHHPEKSREYTERYIAKIGREEYNRRKREARARKKVTP